MASQITLDKVVIVSIWLESALYGFLLALALTSLYVNLTLRLHQNTHSRLMFAAACLMWAIATAHLSVNCYRLVQGYVIHAGDPGGSVGWFSILSSWDHVSKATLFATQVILGGAVAIYRTWILWNKNWKIVVPLCALLIGSAISGYAVCVTYSHGQATWSLFDQKPTPWTSAFFAISFVQSLLTTGLMAYRIWSGDRRSSKYRMDKRGLVPYIYILVESAALQLIDELVAFIIYAAGLNAQYIILETLTPIVAITFNAIAIRIALRSSEALVNMKSSSQQRASHAGPMHTIGGSALPFRAITITIQQDVETDGRSDAEENLDRK